MDSENEKLLTRLQICDFVLLETNIFLDSHPDNKDALDYFKRYNELRKEIAAEYMEKYGPITAKDSKTTDTWTWIDMPWPWQNTEV